MIQGYVRRSRGFNHVDKLLKRFRMPGRSVHCFKSCSQKLLQQAQHAIRAAAKATAAVRGSSMYAWIMSRARFAIGKTLRLSDRRSAVQAAKSISNVDLWHQGIPAWEYWQRGLAVKHMPGNWSIIDRDAESDQQAALGGVPGYRKMAFASMATIMVGLVLLDAGRWSIAPISPQQRNVLIYGASLLAVPAFLRKGPLPKGSFAPYMYPFVKSKCFSGAGGELVPSQTTAASERLFFFKIPWCRAWHLAGRAPQVLMTPDWRKFFSMAFARCYPTIASRTPHAQIARGPHSLSALPRKKTPYMHVGCRCSANV